MDSQTHQVERLVYELTYDVEPGSARALELRQQLKAEVDAIRKFVPRREVHDLEVLIDRRTGWKP